MMQWRPHRRPKSRDAQIPVTVRFEPRVVGIFRRSGRGWQTWLNERRLDMWTGNGVTRRNSSASAFAARW